MNIKDNILNYLYDRDYCLSIYDDYLYIFNFKYLDFFNDAKIVVSLDKRKVTIKGSNILIVKITKEELLIKGNINSVEMDKNEK